MRWPEDAGGWPLQDYSRQILHRPHRWHVQEAGQGQTLLLIHGAGGATQSWRGLFPLLMQSYHVVAVDLPGQGFTQLGARQRCGLDQMSEDLLSLLRSEGWLPHAIVGHSAGAAIALRLAEMMGPTLPRIIGINPALANFRGVASWLFPMMARLLALSPFSADLFATIFARPDAVRKLIRGTGSTLPEDALAFYNRLAGDRAHVDATLAMMAQWSLDGLLSRLPEHRARTLFLAADKDLAVSPDTSDQAAALMPDARVVHLSGYGHLIHEENPGLVADQIRAFLRPN